MPSIDPTIRGSRDGLFDDNTFDRRHGARSPADPILAMIAEAKRLSQLASPIRERADLLWFGLLRGDEVIDGDGNTALALYREADAREAQEIEWWERVETTKATTLGGAIAQLQFLFFACGFDEEVDIIVAGLREIEQRLARGR